jgi:hypothetical protein
LKEKMSGVVGCLNGKRLKLTNRVKLSPTFSKVY